MWYSTNPFATPAPERGGWQAASPSRFTPGKDPVPTVQEAGWASGSLWTAREISPRLAQNILPTELYSYTPPDRNTRKKNPYFAMRSVKN